MLVPPRFPHQNQGVVLRLSQPTNPGYAYGAITLYGGPFQATSASQGGGRYRLSLYTTSPWGLSAPGVRFGLLPFPSPVLRESHDGFFSSPYLDVSVRGVPTPPFEEGGSAMGY